MQSQLGLRLELPIDTILYESSLNAFASGLVRRSISEFAVTIAMCNFVMDFTEVQK